MNKTNHHQLLQYRLAHDAAFEMGDTVAYTYYRKQILSLLNKMCQDASRLAKMRCKVYCNRQKIKEYSVMASLGFTLKNGRYVYPN